MNPLVTVALGLAAVAVIAMWLGAESLAAHRTGRLVLALGLVVLPLGAALTGTAVGFEQSSQTSFCLDCHEMDAHGRSLFVDNPRALAAVHYQRRLISRDSTCYACHTDYAMFGPLQVKLNGLRHVWVHYFGTAPDPLALYQPYPNRNCLHCHDDARGFVANAAHQSIMGQLHADEVSCLSCHDVAHDMAGVQAERFWLGP